MLAYLETKIKIAEERKELFAKFQKELLQQTIAVRVPGGFYRPSSLPSWPKITFFATWSSAAS